jgi:hypothetical protein
MDNQIALRRIWFNLDPRDPWARSINYQRCHHGKTQRRRHVLGFTEKLDILQEDRVPSYGQFLPQRIPTSNKHGLKFDHGKSPFPAPLIAAARSGNVSAMCTLAQLHEVG